MPYDIKWNDSLVSWRYYGTVTEEDVIASHMTIYGDWRFDAIKWKLADLRDVEQFDLTPRSLKKLQHMDRAAALTNPNIKVAIIAESEKSKQVAEDYAGADRKMPWTIQQFESIEQAKDWFKKDA